MSLYRIAIHRPDGGLVLLRPGAKGERDLIDAVVQETVAQGVGLFRTEAHVAAAVQRACERVLRELKSEVVPE